MRGNPRSEFIVLEFGTKRPRVRIPPLRLPGSVDFPTLPGFLFLAKVPFFSGLQPAGLQRGGEAPVWQVEKITSGNFRNFPVFFLAEMSYLHF